MANRLAARLDRAFQDDRVLRLPLAFVFAMMAYGNASRLILLLSDRLTPQISSKALAVAGTGANLLFVVTLFWLTIIRTMPNRSANGVSPRLFAYFGSFSPLVFAALPAANLPDALRILAIFLVIAGVALSVMTVSWLGRSFSIVAQSRRLVTYGPYSIVRHPLYICEEIFVAGIALDHFSWIALLALGAQWCCQLQRMKYEERILVETFPEYKEYARQTPALVPALRVRRS